MSDEQLKESDAILDLITRERNQAFKEGKAVGSGINLGQGALLYNQGYLDGARELAERIKRQIQEEWKGKSEVMYKLELSKLDRILEELTK